MSDLFAEVDQALRQEKLSKTWEENKILIISFVIGTIALTGLISGYKNWKTQTESTQTNAAYALLESQEFPDNINPETLDLKPGLKAMVIAQAAGTYLEFEEPQKALELYSYIANNLKKAEKYSDLALIMTTRLQPDQSPIEALQPIIKDKSNIWRPEALIEAATYEASINNNYDQALTYLNRVKESRIIIPTLREKTEALIHIYTIKAAQEAKDS